MLLADHAMVGHLDREFRKSNECRAFWGKRSHSGKPSALVKSRSVRRHRFRVHTRKLAESVLQHWRQTSQRASHETDEGLRHGLSAMGPRHKDNASDARISLEIQYVFQ